MSETDGTEAPKTMLILKSQPGALGTVENFLRNRGWKIYATSNLKEALVQIVSQKPSYVLISVDHANKKVRALPKILAQAFPVAIIAFAENQSSSSYKMLNETATDYRVYPPVTGPAIERCVNKYLKDQQTKASIQSHDSLRSDGLNSGNDTISVRGGANGSIAVTGEGSSFGDSSVNQLLSQFLADEDTTASASSSSAKNDGLIFAQPIEDDVPPPSSTGFIPGTGTGTAASASPQGLVSAGQAYVQKGSAGNLGSVVPPAGTQQAHGAIENSDKGSLGTFIPPEGLGSREYRRAQAAPAWGPIAATEERTRQLKERRARSDANDTLMARGTHKALEESVKGPKAPVQEKLQDSTNAACILVESVRFSGYLVAVMGKDQLVDAAFIETIKARLFKFLKDNGEDVSNHESLDVKIRQVDFEPWALEYADFLRKSVHKGHEVAMAFFPRRPLKAILEDSHDQVMAKIRLADLQGDRQVEFDLYVYLPANDKYVLYTPKGGVFYNKQMDRLKKQGITHMHVQKEAALAVSKYHAQNYLNDMVEDYEQKQELVNRIKAS